MKFEYETYSCNKDNKEKFELYIKHYENIIERAKQFYDANEEYIKGSPPQEVVSTPVSKESVLSFASDIKPSRDLSEYEYSLYLIHGTAEELETDTITYETCRKINKPVSNFRRRLAMNSNISPEILISLSKELHNV